MSSNHVWRERTVQGPGGDASFNHRRSTWRLTWPFLLLVPLLLIVVGVGAVVQGIGHVVVENGSRLERAQRNAVERLYRYSDACDSAEYQRYQAEMAVWWSFEAARAALFRAEPDRDLAKANYLKAGVSPWDAGLLSTVLPLLQSSTMQAEATVLFNRANAVVHDIDAEAGRLHELLQQGCNDPARHRSVLVKILSLNDQMGVLREKTAAVSNSARWRLSGLVLAVMVAVALPLTLLGYMLSARLQRGAVRATDALDVSEHRLQRALTGSGYGLWDMEVSSGAVYCSASMMQMLGREERDQTVMHTDFMALVHPDEVEAIKAIVLLRIKDGHRLDVELRMRTADGSYRWYRMAGQVSRPDRRQARRSNDRRQTTRLIGSLYDVDDRHALQRALEDELNARRSALRALRATLVTMVSKEADVAATPAQGGNDMEVVAQTVADLGRQLRETNSHLKAIFDLSPDGFVSFDARRRVGFVSPRFVELTGLEADTLLGQHESAFFARLKALCRPSVTSPSLPVLQRRGSDEPLELELLSDPPRFMLLQLRSGQHGSVRDVLCLRDITHEHEVDRLKSEFLTVASHELRTPVTSIFGYVDLMLNREMTPEAQKNVQAIVHRQCGLLIGILDDLMDLSRLESRADLTLSIAEVELADLLRGSAQSFDVPEGREPPLLLDVAAWPRARMACDTAQLRRLFHNILSNAYTYSPDGGPVEIGLALHTEAGGVDELRVSIRDHGIGMTPAQLARVGQRFYRADGSGHVPGTGLGMAIVNEILKLHGGRVSIESTPGEGTQVEVTFPVLVGRLNPD